MKKISIVLNLIFFATLIIFAGNKSENKFSISLDKNWYLIKNSDFPGIAKIQNGNDILKYKNINSDIPATVLAAMVNAGVYKNIYFDKGLEKIDKAQFKESWWYLKEFSINEKNDFYSLLLEGVNYQANVYLNGNLIADTNVVEGPFAIKKIEVTKYLKEKNILAIQVYPPVRGDLTIGFVDWNPPAPDNSMGLWRGVKLLRSNMVEMIDPFVYSNLSDDNKNAKIVFETTLKNNSEKLQTAELKIEFANKTFIKEIKLNASEKLFIQLTEKEFQALNVNNPELWWPNGYGKQVLHNLTAKVKVNNKLSASETIRFGIRKFEDYYNEAGHRGYKVNGKNILIKGAGWVDDLLLADSDQKVRYQLEYVKEMNHNTVRLEGFWGKNKTIYNVCDELGLMIMIGWSCQWEWQGYCGRPETDFMSIDTPKDIELNRNAYIDQVRWLRNHASVFLWVFGSDKMPVQELEQKLRDDLKVYDRTRPILASCKNWYPEGKHINVSKISGHPGVKMLGPYAYVTPNYWYEDTTAGGAYGFNTETGTGQQVPPMVTLKKMLPEKNLWPMDEMWNYHCGRNEFNTLNSFLPAFKARYGEFNDALSFTKYNQLSNYEAMRPMFEAFAVNFNHSTGIVQWMLNSAWPEMYWQLYDWYLMPNGAYYGSKNACRNLNIVYNYGNQGIYVINHNYQNYDNLKAEIKIYDLNSKLITSEVIDVNINENQSKKIYSILENNISTNNYFVDLRIINGKDRINNFYWLSKTKDVHDYAKSDWYYTPFKSFADYKELRKLQSVKPQIKTIVKNNEVIVRLKNTSDKIAFFLEAQLNDKNTNDVVLPHIWSDNYITLLPGEEREIKVKYFNKNIKPEVIINTLN